MFMPPEKQGSSTCSYEIANYLASTPSCKTIIEQARVSCEPAAEVLTAKKWHHEQTLKRETPGIVFTYIRIIMCTYLLYMYYSCITHSSLQEKLMV